MPPRITRNSDRPRASDRTMVDANDATTRLPTFSRLDRRRHHRQMNPTGMANKPEQNPRANRGTRLQQWAGCRDKNLTSGRGEAFFLDIPFYRTQSEIGRWRSIVRGATGVALFHDQDKNCEELRNPLFFPVGVFGCRSVFAAFGTWTGRVGVGQRGETVPSPSRELASSDSRGAAIRI
jgi:hypothetical protein